MGIHICLMKDGQDHPEWNYLRVNNDLKFPDLIDWNNVIKNPKNYEEWRPTDIDKLRERINSTDWDNKERYLRFVDLIESDHEYWVYFSL